jgi:precorrin-6A/cobalt-precorrin-6A reductase
MRAHPTKHARRRVDRRSDPAPEIGNDGTSGRAYLRAATAGNILVFAISDRAGMLIRRIRAMSDRPHLLILGGTAEAAALAVALVDRVRVTNALAGRTAAPVLPPGECRIGGFGDAEGLAAWLCANDIDLVVDATHPFATRISAHAVAACAATGRKLLRLERPAWRPVAGDRWLDVADPASAAALLARIGGRAFLTVGRQSLSVFQGLDHVWKLVRLIAPPADILPLAPYELVLGRGPFTIEAERYLLASRRITVLVTKASGGVGTEAKLAAARLADIPVIMIRRPLETAGAGVRSVEDAVAWVLTEARPGLTK